MPETAPDFNYNRGFTLIELSIVLVIIGLIVGGVLVGRDLIAAAGINKTIAEKDQIDAAVNAFRLKYNCLPGDCPNATTFGFETNGNGDGNFDTSYGNASVVDEERIFWRSLHDSGLLALPITSMVRNGCENTFPGYQTPKTYLGQTIADTSGCIGGAPIGGWWLYDSDTMVAMDYSGSGGAAAYPSGYQRPTWKSYALLASDHAAGTPPILTNNQMRNIDQKIDDGLPMTGSVRAIWEYKYSTYSDPSAVTFNNPAGNGGGNAGYVCVPSNSLTAGYISSDAINYPAGAGCDLIMRVGW